MRLYSTTAYRLGAESHAIDVEDLSEKSFCDLFEIMRIGSQKSIEVSDLRHREIVSKFARLVAEGPLL